MTSVLRPRPTPSPYSFGLSLGDRSIKQVEVISRSSVTSSAAQSIQGETPQSRVECSSFPSTSSLYSAQDFRASKIEGLNLYLGNESDAMSLNVLMRHGVRRIVNIAEECRPSKEVYYASQFVGKYHPLDYKEGSSLDGAMQTPPTVSPEMCDGVWERLDTAVPVASPQPKPTAFHQFPLVLEEHEPKIQYLFLPIRDTPDADISVHFNETSQFIREGLERGEGILVHCRMGISRSATVVLAYLMTYGLDLKQVHPITYERALRKVREVRQNVSPNLGFGQALRALDVQHGLRKSVYDLDADQGVTDEEQSPDM